ncbi:MAG: glycosyltransferase [Firmicutes bacterium]|nr:glycosyltransferase [Bacillota bacterium]
MKIALIADVFGKENNGTTITAKRLVENMRLRGHDVKVIASSGGDVQLKRRSIFGFNWYLKLNQVELAKPDKKIIKEAIADCDVVHFLLPFLTSRKSIKLIREMEKPYTTAFHCQPENFSSHLFLHRVPFFNRFLYRRFNRLFYKRTQFIHCPSKFIADQLVKNGYTADKRVISNGVIPTFEKRNVSKPEELKDKICILFTGRYVPEKRHDLLIKAVKISKYADKIQIIFAGGGPKLNKIKKLGRSLKNPPITKLFTKDELCDTINYCDLYVHPSDVEIEAIAAIEAFTCGLVPVISDSPNSATGQFALCEKNLFRHGDPAHLAERIDYWIEHEQEKKELGEKYITYAAQYSIKNCMDQMEKMFLDSIEHYTYYYAERRLMKAAAKKEETWKAAWATEPLFDKEKFAAPVAITEFEETASEEIAVNS